jgi:hypothetical protein
MIMKLTPADLKALSATAWDVISVDGGVVIETEDGDGYAVFVFLADDVIDNMNLRRLEDPSRQSIAYYQVRLDGGKTLTYSSALALDIGDLVSVPVEFSNGHQEKVNGLVSGYGREGYHGPAKEIDSVISRSNEYYS